MKAAKMDKAFNTFVPNLSRKPAHIDKIVRQFYEFKKQGM